MVELELVSNEMVEESDTIGEALLRIMEILFYRTGRRILSTSQNVKD